MPRPKALLIFGTRPDAIKMAPVVRAFRQRSDKIKTVIAVTGQHRTQLDQVLQTFNIQPDFDLDIMEPGADLAAISSRSLQGLNQIFDSQQPAISLAQGDTTTTFVASLASFYHKVPFGHVEAGLRTDNRFDPFPEEINRRLTGVLAELHFAPTAKAQQRLLDEGVSPSKVFLTGNTVIDALLDVAGRPHQFEDPRLAALQQHPGRVILLTMHRRENLGEPMQRVCAAIKILLDRFSDLKIVWPMHRNPRVREVVIPSLGTHPQVVLVDALEYAPLVHLLKLSTLALVDSGGIQEEAPSLGKPVLVARETTERPEGVEAGVARLVGTSTETVVNSITELLTHPEVYEQMSRAQNPYGDGSAAERICQHSLNFLEGQLPPLVRKIR